MCENVDLNNLLYTPTYAEFFLLEPVFTSVSEKLRQVPFLKFAYFSDKNLKFSVSEQLG